jgi:hypothetical protein
MQLIWPQAGFWNSVHFYMVYRRDAVFDPELRPKGARGGFFKEIFSLRPLGLCGELWL